ncbi:MAG: glycosyltransferase [Candidatus Delongbacteria bacterium]|jgi:hypothetical protein|nr:glycosyltransferase [Candidatus Delongbacteria bacterium]
MKVCMILKRNFEMLKTDSRVLREASALIEAGYEVYLIIFSSNGEEIITEYKGIKIKQVKIKSFWGLDKYNLFSINNKGYQDFIGKLMFFLPYNFLYYRRALQVASDINVDIYHCHDFETLSIGYKLKKRLGCKLIYDSHELWTESSYFSILPKIISLPLKMITVFLEKKIIRRTDINITVNDSISHYLYKKYNIIKPKVIRNVPKFIPIKNNENLLRKEFKLDSEKKIVIYQGYLSINRGIENVLSSWEYVNNNIVLIFMGYGPLLNKIKQIIKNKKLSNRIFIKKAVKPE